METKITLEGIDFDFYIDTEKKRLLWKRYVEKNNNECIYDYYFEDVFIKKDDRIFPKLERYNIGEYVIYDSYIEWNYSDRIFLKKGSLQQLIFNGESLILS